jgi:large subunit ribosomal protein L5
MTQRLKQRYLNTVVPNLCEQFKFTNVHQVPKLSKIVINCGLGEASQNAKALESTLRDLTVITGQKPVVTRAKKAIASFSIRANMPVGVCVTLRGEAMYSFIDRLIHLALPRIRDFKGLNLNSFDRHGNLHLGLKEQLMFPEISYDHIYKMRGMNICIVTTCKHNEEAARFLTSLGMPFHTHAYPNTYT